MKQEDVNGLIGKSTEARVKNDHDMTRCPNCSKCIRDLRSDRDYLQGAFEDRDREMWKALDCRLMLCDMALNEPDDDMRELALRAVIEQHHRNEGVTFYHPFRKYAAWRSR
jgi:hypothetical protein